MNDVINFGVLEGRRATDYVAGPVGGTLPYENRNPSADWTPYLPAGERQSNRQTETMACVSYSLNNVIESQIKFLTGQELNFSDRWLAKMSDTTPEGNYLWKVADAVRLKGLVPEASWPVPPNFTWNSYYASIPPAIQSKGKEFLENYAIAYEWVELTPANLLKHLKQSPLQLVIPGHAIMGFYSYADVVKYFDSYEPFIKGTTVGALSDALKVVVTKKVNSMDLVNDNGTYYLVGPKGKIGLADPEALAMIKAITDQEQARSTSAVPQVRVIKKGLIVA